MFSHLLRFLLTLYREPHCIRCNKPYRSRFCIHYNCRLESMLGMLSALASFCKDIPSRLLVFFFIVGIRYIGASDGDNIVLGSTCSNASYQDESGFAISVHFSCALLKYSAQ